MVLVLVILLVKCDGMVLFVCTACPWGLMVLVSCNTIGIVCVCSLPKGIGIAIGVM